MTFPEVAMTIGLCTELDMSRNGYVPKRLCPEVAMSRNGYVPKRLCPETAMSRNGYVPTWLCPETVMSRSDRHSASLLTVAAQLLTYSKLYVGECHPSDWLSRVHSFTLTDPLTQ